MNLINILFIAIDTNDIYIQKAPIQEIRILKKTLDQDFIPNKFQDEKQDELLIINNACKATKPEQFIKILNENVEKNKTAIVFHSKENNISILSRNGIHIKQNKNILIFDTLKLARKVFDMNFRSYSLENICKNVNLNYKNNQKEESIANLFLLECSHILSNSMLDKFFDISPTPLILNRIFKIQEEKIKKRIRN